MPKPRGPQSQCLVMMMSDSWEKKSQTDGADEEPDRRALVHIRVRISHQAHGKRRIKLFDCVCVPYCLYSI